MNDKFMIVGADPGASGGIGFEDTDGKVYSKKMPQTDGDLREYFRALVRHNEAINPGGRIVCFMELVQGYIGPKTKYMTCHHCGGQISYKSGDPGKTMFTFGANYGALRLAIICHNISLELVSPRTWQSEVGVPRKEKGMTKTQWKNIIKQKAQRLFPDQKVTLATADALCILQYGRLYFKRENALPF